ncbi:MAG: hypothetical protein NTZ40_13180 [Cyanobacteria bacterium]|nr:hypothetical protein [Cyanobacteriota bacterium]
MELIVRRPERQRGLQAGQSAFFPRRLGLARQSHVLAAPQASAPRPQAAEEVRDSGSFHPAKVRILGIPVITVTSPLAAAAGGPDAQQRARVPGKERPLLSVTADNALRPPEILNWPDGFHPQWEASLPAMGL